MPSVPDLSRLIPLSARTVLFAGHGLNQLGAAYRRFNPTARLFALDTGPEPTPGGPFEARATMYPGLPLNLPSGPPPGPDPLADTPLSFSVPDGFDCIVYSAPLEDLDDPFALLAHHARQLAPDGTILIRVHNPECWTHARGLLTGAPQSETPARWLRLEDMSAGLATAGLIAVDVQLEESPDPEGAAFIEAIAPGLRNRGIEPAAYARTALPRYYIWRARKQPVRRMAIAGDMLRPIGGVSHLRVLHPLAAMATDPATITRLAPIDNPPDLGATLGNPDGPDTAPRVFILHRPGLFGERGQALIDGLIARGWLVITEFDDNPDHMPGMTAPGLVSFAGVHAIQTTTPVLADLLRQRNPELAMFPNAIAELPDIRNFTDPGELTVFFGALNREQDWRPIMGPINAIARRLGDRLRFRVVHDEGFFLALETTRKTFTPLCDYDTYLDLLGTSEISLMPLDDTPFNRAKSDLKFIEAGACRVATLASTVVYRHSVADGETGLLFDGPESFHRQFLRLAAIPDLALNIGDNARRMVERERMLADQVAPRLAWYRDLWHRRAELTEALRARAARAVRPAA